MTDPEGVTLGTPGRPLDGPSEEFSEEDLEHTLQQLVMLVEPILGRIAERSAKGHTVTLKPKQAQILWEWIMSVINTNTILTSKVEALQEALGEAAQAATEQRIWTPPTTRPGTSA